MSEDVFSYNNIEQLAAEGAKHLADRCRDMQPYYYENWPQGLKDHYAFKNKIVSVKLPLEEIKPYFDCECGESPPHPLIKEIEDYFSQPYTQAFIKLSSRCPKDYLAPGIGNIAKPMFVTSAKQAWEALACSERTLDDLAGFFNAGIDPYLHITPYVCIDMQTEWRCYVLGGRLAAISQYYYMLGFEGFTQADSVLHNAEGFIDKISSYLPCPDIVVDIVAPHQFPVRLLEINPLRLSDPLLFTHDDIEQLRGKPPVLAYNESVKKMVGGGA